MNSVVLKTNNLTKSYHGVNALQDVSVTIEAGRIYGLIGRNGAGKSTFMRLVTGLCFPESGSIELFGHSGSNSLQAERKRIGSMIEYPSFIPSMTAKENLHYRRIMLGIPNRESEDEILSLVGLSGAGKKKTKNFSLGMKQRLGIAMALIGNPEFLILDEPINGLDPVGIVEIRSLIKKQCEEQQITILISSHNLPELYQIASDYIIIHNGRILKALTLSELEEHCARHLLISCEQPEKLAVILETKLHTNKFRVMPDKSIRLFDFLDKKELISKVMYENGILLTNLSNEGETLEDYFISIVGSDKNV